MSAGIESGMRCLRCGEIMIDYDDVVQDNLRIDWKRCPRCGSKAEVILHPHEYYILQATWSRETPKVMKGESK